MRIINGSGTVIDSLSGSVVYENNLGLGQSSIDLPNEDIKVAFRGATSSLTVSKLAVADQGKEIVLVYSKKLDSGTVVEEEDLDDCYFFDANGDRHDVPRSQSDYWVIIACQPENMNTGLAWYWIVLIVILSIIAVAAVLIVALTAGKFGYEYYKGRKYN